METGEPSGGVRNRLDRPILLLSLEPFARTHVECALDRAFCRRVVGTRRRRRRLRCVKRRRAAPARHRLAVRALTSPLAPDRAETLLALLGRRLRRAKGPGGFFEKIVPPILFGFSVECNVCVLFW